MKLVKYRRMGNWILMAGILLCCLYAFHDMHTAEGIGLYLAAWLGVEQRIFMDIAVDVLCMGVLAALIYIPCRVLGYWTSEAGLRLLIGYLALMPSLSLSRLVELFQNRQSFLWEMDFTGALYVWIYSVAPFLQVWVPLFILLYGIGKVYQCLDFKGWYRWIILGQCVLLLGLLLVPTADNMLLYVAAYPGLLVGFDCWEAVLQKLPALKKWSVLFWGLLLLRGMFRLIVLMSQY